MRDANCSRLKVVFPLFGMTAVAIAGWMPSVQAASPGFSSPENKQPEMPISVKTDAISKSSDGIEFSTDLEDLNLAQDTEPAPDAPEEPFEIDTEDVEVGRATRSGSSYIGIGGNLGIGDGDTALGETSFSVFSKVGLTSNISVRPSVLIEDDPTILLPLTLDFTPGVTETSAEITDDINSKVAPFIGAGVAISAGDDSSVDLLATGGVDIPLSDRFTATASINASLFDNPAVGLLLGIGYNFR
mgnify:CR=1 FL=1